MNVLDGFMLGQTSPDLDERDGFGVDRVSPWVDSTNLLPQWLAVNLSGRSFVYRPRRRGESMTP
jgi:hypothetical protein